MRRHERGGFPRHYLQGKINLSYREEQLRRSPPDAKYPGTDAKGFPIVWSVCDRFHQLNRIVYAVRYLRIRHPVGSWSRKQEVETIRRMIAALATMDKPRIPK